MFGLFKRKTSDGEFPWVEHAIKAAESSEIDPDIFIALILNESSGNPLATRWERKFYIRYISDKQFDAMGGNQPINLDPYQESLERLCRAVSWGLTQVMGQTAREHGFRGRYLWELLDVETNVCLGARIFAHKREQQRKLYSNATAQDLTRKTLLAYNGGGDPAYPDRVEQRLEVAKDLRRSLIKAQGRC